MEYKIPHHPVKIDKIMIKSFFKKLNDNTNFLIFIISIITISSIAAMGILFYYRNKMQYIIWILHSIMISFLALASIFIIIIRYYYKKRSYEQSITVGNEFQAILKNMINAFVVWESVFDKNGNYVSFRFGYFNDAYSRISKLKLKDVQGKDVFEVWPNTEKRWLEIYRDVAMSGKSITFEQYHEPTMGLYLCNAYRPTRSNNYICVIFENVTEKRQAEQELKKSEERLRLSLKATNQGLFDINLQTDESIVNDEFAIMLGYDPSTFVESYESFKARLHPDDMERSLKHLDELKSGELSEDHNEFRQKRKDGSYIWVLSMTKTIEYDANGKPLRMIGTHIDITSRKIAEKILKESEEQYKSFFNNNYAVMLIIDPDSNLIIDANKAACEYYGWTHEEITSKDMSQISLLPLNVIVENSLKIIEGRLKYILSRHRLSNGVARDVEIYTGTIPVAGKMLIYNIIHDITDRRLAEKMLAEEKERLSVTLRSIGDGVITTDLKGRVIIMNKIAEILTGWTDQEAYGKPLSEIFNIINEITRETCKNPVDQVLSTGEITELANHTILIARDGTERIIADSGAPIKNKNNMTIGVVLVFRDITEKQKLLEKLQRTEKLNTIGIMAGGIAHDFNNLLNSIYGYIELAKEETEKENYTVFLNKALQSFNRARDLTHQLLTFAKGGNPVLKTGALGPILMNNCDFALAGTNVTCDLDISPNLWPSNFDENQISQVINNILINAQQAMQSGGKIIIKAANFKADEIKDKNYNYNNYIHISISDTGPGIPRDIIQNIFDPFFTTKAGGTGLGLATSYSIIRNHKGYIEADSEPGKGSTFHIYLPASQKEPAGDYLRSAPVHRGSGKILVMDDEEFNLDVVGLMLEKLGYSALKAINGEEAMKLFIEYRESGDLISALLLDLTINRGMGGKETVYEIRKIDKDIPVFASSGYSEDPVMSNPSKYGFTDSIRKPYNIPELAEILKRYLD